MKASLIDTLVFETMAEQAMAKTSVGPACDGLTMDQIEEAVIRYQIAKNGGNRRLVAEATGISERVIYRKLAQYGMKTP